ARLNPFPPERRQCLAPGLRPAPAAHSAVDCEPRPQPNECLVGAGDATRTAPRVQLPQSQPVHVFSFFLPPRFLMSRRLIVFGREHLDDLARHWLALDSLRISFRRRCPDPYLKTFHGQDALIQQSVVDTKAAAAPFGY